MKRDSVFIPASVTFLMLTVTILVCGYLIFTLFDSTTTQTILGLCLVIVLSLGLKNFEPEVGTNILLFGAFTQFCFYGGWYWLPFYPIVSYKRMVTKTVEKDGKMITKVIDYGTQGPMNNFLLSKEIMIQCKNRVVIRGERPITYPVRIIDLARFVQASTDAGSFSELLAGMPIETIAKEIGSKNEAIDIIGDEPKKAKDSHGNEVEVTSVEKFVKQEFFKVYPNGIIPDAGIQILENIDFPNLIGSESYMKKLEDGAGERDSETLLNDARQTRMNGSLNRLKQLKDITSDLSDKDAMEFVGMSDKLYGSSNLNQENIDISFDENAVKVSENLGHLTKDPATRTALATLLRSGKGKNEKK